jgi:hypothetical protein
LFHRVTQDELVPDLSHNSHNDIRLKFHSTYTAIRNISKGKQNVNQISTFSAVFIVLQSVFHDLKELNFNQSWFSLQSIFDNKNYTQMFTSDSDGKTPFF